MELRLNSILLPMENKEVQVLKRALEREKKARHQAERILEEKSKELYDVTEHLKESKSKLEDLLCKTASDLDGNFINIIDPYVVMDLKGEVIKMNISAKEFLGYDHTKESFNLTSLIHKDFVQYTVQSMKSLIELGKINKYKAKIVVKSGESRWVEVNSSLIYDTNRKPVAAQGIIRDITQEMEIKQLLSEQRRQLDIIVQNSPLGIVLSAGDTIIKANSTFIELFGYSEIELKKININDISVPEDIETNNRLVVEMNEGKLDKFTVTKRFFRKNGSCVLTKTLVSAVKDAQGNIEYQLALVEDIAKEREAEERLNTERQKYGNIIANMNLGLLEVDTDDVIQLVNQSFCTMSGFREEELLGKKAADYLKVKDKKLIVDKNKERSNGKSDSYEVEVRDKVGNKKYWLISGAPRYDVDKNIIGSIGIHLDITNQKLLEQQKEGLLKELENSNKGLQEYAHIVSHDLKSPLRSISALATWIQEDYKDILDEAGQHNLQMMQEKVAAMDKLIHGILEYSTANSSELDKSQVDLNNVVAEVGESIFIPDHVKLCVPEVLPKILADNIKMHQLFQNIMGNAVVHIDKEEGLVEVLYKENKTHLCFTIKDNGVGIPKEYHKKIFEIFQSVGHSERSTGIGLSIVKKIVDRYGGEVWVDSEMGIGTEFHFTLKKEFCQLK